MSNLENITDSNFEEIVGTDGLVLVDLWAPWCGPCKMLVPILEIIAGEEAGHVRIVKMDVDTNPKTSSKYNVRSIPTMLFFKNGKLLDSVVGALPKGKILEKIKQHCN